MDYHMADGSQFSLREIWRKISPTDEDRPQFVYTSISANVDGKAYFGRLDERAQDADEGDVLACLEAVPPKAIFPEFRDGLSEAPPFDPLKHYLKAPSFTWDDCQPGTTFVADCVLNEVNALEQLKDYKHANVVGYHGCVVADGRITHVCLERCQRNIVDYVEDHEGSSIIQEFIKDVKTGIKFLHSLGLAHNDINPSNICITQDGHAVIVDFDGCLPFGEPLMKGVSTKFSDDGRPISAAENDIRGLEDVEDFLMSLETPKKGP